MSLWREFERGEQLGRTALGTFVAATRARDGRPAFVKYADQATVRREALALRRVGDHPTVVALLGAFEGRNPCVVLGRVEGPDLCDWLATKPSAGIAARQGLYAALFGALAFCHARGVLHLDVKTENVMWGGDPARDPVLVDFGLAEILPADGGGGNPEGVVRLEAPRGTRSLCPPEMLRDGTAGPFSDVFCCGRLVAECEGVLRSGRGPRLLSEVVASTTCERWAERPSAEAARVRLRAGALVRL